MKRGIKPGFQFYSAAAVKNLSDRGVNHFQIAKALGISRTTVAKYLKKGKAHAIILV